MAKKYYHNVTQGEFNETCVIDLVEGSDEGDLILVSEAGNACVRKLEQNEWESLQKEVEDSYEED